MTSPNHLEDEDDFGGDFSGTRRPGSKRSFGELDDEKEDIFCSKKGNIRAEETAPGAATGTILSLRESLKNCEETLATCQSELEVAKSEIQKWHSSFLKEPFTASESAPEPRIVVNYLQNLRASEELLQEQLEKAKKKEAAFIVNIAKRDQEIAELKSFLRDLRTQLKPPSMQARKFLLDPAIHEEFTRLQNLVDEKDKKVKELQDNIAAVNFTPQSKNGKLLMAKCRTLQEENEEIGNQANEGKMHDMSMKLALQKSQNAELRSHLEGLCRQIEGLTNDVDISNEMVFILQEKLEEKEADIRRLKKELEMENEAHDKADIPGEEEEEEEKRSDDDNKIVPTNEEVST